MNLNYRTTVAFNFVHLWYDNVSGMWKTYGHKFAIDTISRSMKLGRLPHAYLLNGPEGIGKKTLAVDIACVVNCLDSGVASGPCGTCSQCIRILSGNHTDLFMYDPESSKSASDIVSIDQLRNDFLKQIHRKPFEGKYRVFIIAALERMRAEQSNILLKTLEEPPSEVIIILLSEQIDELLDTVISRCQLFDLRPLSTADITAYVVKLSEEVKLDSEGNDVKEICRLARGRVGWAHRAIEDSEILNNRHLFLDKCESAVFGELPDRFDFSREMAFAFSKNRQIALEGLDTWLTWWRDVLLIKSGDQDAILNISRVDKLQRTAEFMEFDDLISIIKSIRMTFIYLEKNLNLGLTFDNLMLKMPFLPRT